MRHPVPEPSELTAGFWDAAQRGELVAQRCADCRTWRHYPQLLCPTCRSSAWAWEQLSGRGSVYSFSVAHQAFHPAWTDRVPYVVATIELIEGIRMVSDLDEPEDAVSIGHAVDVFYDTASDGITLPRFRLVI
jgi:uncharacterized OB-fold protein